ncbi:hypothetical protein KN248_008145 [Mycobacterium paraintracellulare]|uniref:hypothetical protein n=1 Tax=Mycobacterium paraintracellulare TaxID=1138383 RepID=UPI001EEDF980|nr:hypothetical protein [Mycobacterium paraintracellulare]WVL49984.1 hypothetical protein KN248_008145 [Mycobacterium paraintracellulare]
MTCDNCGREAERLRGGNCARCLVTQQLELLLKPHSPPDMRIKRLIVELAAVPRPESILTWMRNVDTANLLAQIGTRELQLSHAAFDALPPSRNVEHLREMLVHHRMMPSRGDPIMFRFEIWVGQQLKSLEATPAIRVPIEQYTHWHHLRRLREPSQRPRNMDNATRFAKQQITEATKFLRWLLDEHRTVIANLRQEHIDSYLSEGPTTRTAVLNFIRWRAAAGIGERFKTHYRSAATTPLMTSAQRLALIKTTIEADHTVLSARIAALILLLYGVPVSRIAKLTVADIESSAAGTSIKVGVLAAPIPRALLPIFHGYLAARQRGTMNHGSPWLFPGLNAGQHTTEQVLMHQLRRLGIDIKAARNGALHDLIKEIDPASLADLLGYTANTLNIHAARAAVPMATYPAVGALRDGSHDSEGAKHSTVKDITPPILR